MKKILFVFIFLAISLCCLAIFSQKKIAIMLKELAVKELEKIVNTKVEIDSLNVNLFNGIVSFSGMRTENPPGFHEKYFADIRRGHVDVSLRSLLLRRPRIQKIFLDKPTVNIETSRDSVSNAKLIFKKKGAANNAALSGKTKKQSSGFRINEIDIKNGVFKFVNYKVNQDGAEMVFDEISVLVKELTDSKNLENFPTSVTCSARLPAGEFTGRLELSARGNFISDSIDFDCDLRADNISLAYFMPFYVNSAAMLARKGRFNLYSAAECRENRLNTTQKVNIMDLEVVLSRENISDKTIFGLPVMTVMNFFVNSQGRLNFDFAITGTLSDPKFHLAEALKKVLVGSIANAILNRLSQLPNAVFEKVKETGKIENTGKEVLKDVFQKILAPNKEQGSSNGK